VVGQMHHLLMTAERKKGNQAVAVDWEKKADHSEESKTKGLSMTHLTQKSIMSSRRRALFESMALKRWEVGEAVTPSDPVFRPLTDREKRWPSFAVEACRMGGGGPGVVSNESRVSKGRTRYGI